jgi:hypothetical protein
MTFQVLLTLWYMGFLGTIWFGWSIYRISTSTLNDAVYMIILWPLVLINLIYDYLRGRR